MISDLNRDDSDVSEVNEEEEDAELEDEKENENAPIMSLFASFYGIDDPTKTVEEKSSNGTIDDASFHPENYVKDLLLNETMETLVVKDAEMVHEIRTLDGEMQKLVYDNYNKFITATETIKEMKSDVDGMDGDMNSVQSKMRDISKLSQSLDSLMEGKRSKVDKLVRVRRLLDRLEFLSELPERLAEMIENKLYRDAVQLYNKTISVLTRHSHVLSFKKIKERTELMMADLTEKVLGMLDDPTLEAVKLTQFVSILNLMRAPRTKVMHKFIAAHQARSSKMIEAFKTLKCEASVVIEARQFHQSIIVGLIEAYKGILELYSTDVDCGSQLLADFKSMVSRVMHDYSLCFCDSLKQFYERYQQAQSTHTFDFSDFPAEDMKAIEEFDVFKSRNTDCQDNNAAILLLNLQEESRSWHLLIRQSILDVGYLENMHYATLNKLGSRGEEFSVNFKSLFSNNVIQEVEIHLSTMSNILLDEYMKNLNNWMVRLNSFVSNLASPRSTSSGSDSYNNFASQNDRPLFYKTQNVVGSILNLLANHCCEVFEESASHVKPLVEIYEACSKDPRQICKTLVRGFGNNLVAKIKTISMLKVDIDLNNRLRNSLPEREDVISDPIELEMSSQEMTVNSLERLQMKNSFYYAAILRYLAQNLPQSIENELCKEDYPPLDSLSQEKVYLVQSFHSLSQALISVFLEVNCAFTTDQLVTAELDLYRSVYTTVQNSPNQSLNKTVAVSNAVLNLVEYLDLVASYCFLLLLEVPPQVRFGNDREILRRSGGRTGPNSVQMDIDRLFSQNIKVFSVLPSECGTEFILNTIFKASLKAVQEEIKSTILPYEAYIQLQADLSFLKLTTGSLLKESTEIENFIEHTLTSIFGRYLGANSISNATDNSEVGILHKAHQDALLKISDKMILVKFKA